MVRLRILSGKKAGTQWDARRFPVRIGRSATSDLQLEEAGVWDDHFKLTFSRAEGFRLVGSPDALVTVNQEPVQTVRLHNGDSIEVGAVRMQFWLRETRQRGLRLREWFVWTLIVATSLAELAAIYWLRQ
jgi:hypothetical protein